MNKSTYKTLIRNNQSQTVNSCYLGKSKQMQYIAVFVRYNFSFERVYRHNKTAKHYVLDVIQFTVSIKTPNKHRKDYGYDDKI